MGNKYAKLGDTDKKEVEYSCIGEVETSAGGGGATRTSEGTSERTSEPFPEIPVATVVTVDDTTPEHILSILERISAKRERQTHSLPYIVNIQRFGYEGDIRFRVFKKYNKMEEMEVIENENIKLFQGIFEFTSEYYLTIFSWTRGEIETGIEMETKEEYEQHFRLEREMAGVFGPATKKPIEEMFYVLVNSVGDILRVQPVYMK